MSTAAEERGQHAFGKPAPVLQQLQYPLETGRVREAGVGKSKTQEGTSQHRSIGGRWRGSGPVRWWEKKNDKGAVEVEVTVAVGTRIDTQFGTLLVHDHR